MTVLNDDTSTSPAGDVFDVEVRPTKADYKMYGRIVGRRIGKWSWPLFITCCVIAFGITLVLNGMSELFEKVWFRCIVNLLAISVLTNWLYKVFWRRAHATELEDNSFTAQKTFSIRPEGVKIKSPKTTLTTEWSAIEEIQETSGYILFYVGKAAAFLLAKRDIGDEQRTEGFLQLARTYWNDARNQLEVTTPERAPVRVLPMLLTVRGCLFCLPASALGMLLAPLRPVVIPSSGFRAKPGKLRRTLQRFLLPGFIRPCIDADGYFSPHGFCWMKANYSTKVFCAEMSICELTTGPNPPPKVLREEAEHLVPKLDDFYLHNDKATPVLTAISVIRQRSVDVTHEGKIS